MSPALRPLHLPKETEATLSNGLRVLVAPRGRIPLVSIRLSIHGGSAADVPGKEGLADFAAKLLRRGAASLSADAIDEAVELHGGSLAIGAGEDTVALAITAPAEHLGPMLDVLGKIVASPTFALEEVASARERTLAQLASELDDPSAVAERAITRAIWGEHPYGHDVSGRPASVATFTRDDALAFHRDRTGPKVTWLTVVGAVQPARAIELAEEAFAPWRGGPESSPEAPRRERADMAGKILLVDKPDQTQSQVRIGDVALTKRHPDYLPATVVNCVLGAGFTSRLVDEIRVNRGLSYGVSSYLGPLRSGGTLVIDTFTKTGSTREIIDVALAEVEKLRKKGLRASELEKAKTYLCGLFPLRIETNEALAAGFADLRLNALGNDWIERYRERVQAVTQAEALRLAREHFLPRPPAIAIVGKASEVAPQLEGLGEIVQIKVADVG